MLGAIVQYNLTQFLVTEHIPTLEEEKEEGEEVVVSGGFLLLEGVDAHSGRGGMLRSLLARIGAGSFWL